VTAFAIKKMLRNFATILRNKTRFILQRSRLKCSQMLHKYTPWFIKTGYYIVGDNFIKC